VALENVPPYLIEVLRKVDPELQGRFVETAERLTQRDIQQLSDLLEQWVADGDYWNAFGQSLDNASQAQSLDTILDQERRVLIEALNGDERLADTILLELPSQPRRKPDPQQTRQVIIVIQNQIQVVEPAPRGAPAGRRLRIARLLRRTFKAAVGGVAIAADIVVPDPSMIVRISSIVAGADLIIDAVAPQLIQ
jgi:hypothetical protein